MAVRVSQHSVLALIEYNAPSPTSPAASTVAISQHSVLALVGDNPQAKVSQYMVLALVSDDDGSLDPPDTGTGGGGGVRVFGYAG